MKARPVARPNRSDRRRPRYGRDVPVDYVDALLTVRPGLAEEPASVIRGVAGLLADLDGKRYVHRANDGSLSITHQELDEAAPGGRGGRKFFEQHRLLVALGDDYTSQRTRRYMRHPDIAEMDRAYDQRYRDLTAPLVDLFMHDGRTRREIPPAIAGKDDRGNTAKLWGGAPVQCVVPVNLELLLGACTYWERQARSVAIDAHNRQAFARMARLAGKLIQGAHTKVAGRGKIIIQYQESASGRLYGIGPLNLQNVKRLVRFAAMHGMVDYDIQNCHYSILRQLANQHGVLCPTIDEYLAHKSAVRSRLAKEIGCGLEQIKQCLIALAMVGALPDPTSLMLLQHDGFTCSRRLDVRSLELAVLLETGFTVTIDEQIVQSAHQIDRAAARGR